MDIDYERNQRMISISEVEAMLEEAAEQIPEELYRDLNGGIILLPEAKLHHQQVAGDLYILGEYHRSRGMGRYIAIYYGSFEKASAHLTNAQLKKKLAHTLKHEFTHHIESLAGERDLEYEDERNIARYLSQHRRRK